MNYGREMVVSPLSASWSRGVEAAKQLTYCRIISLTMCWLLLIVIGDAAAYTLTGKVIGVADGDTITVLDESKTQHKIRLAGIDAPEKKQPFGERSKQSLSTMVFQKFITVEWSKRDRYGRVVGKVMVNGQDVGLAQVSAGFAWHYKAYEREQSRADKDTYAQAEDEARSDRRGLWRDTKPTPPWEFRRPRKSGR